MVAFSWQLLLDRLPTRTNLCQRKVLHEDDDLFCVFCNSQFESALHLFLHCPFTSSLWSHISLWLGTVFQQPISLLHFFVIFGEGCIRRVNFGTWLLVWHAAVWCIWELRNDIMFEKDKVDMIYLLDRVKVCSWRWFSARHHASTWSFSDWCIDPMNCI